MSNSVSTYADIFTRINPREGCGMCHPIRRAALFADRPYQSPRGVWDVSLYSLSLPRLRKYQSPRGVWDVSFPFRSLFSFCLSINPREGCGMCPTYPSTSVPDNAYQSPRGVWDVSAKITKEMPEIISSCSNFTIFPFNIIPLYFRKCNTIRHISRQSGASLHLFIVLNDLIFTGSQNFALSSCITDIFMLYLSQISVSERVIRK